MNSIIAKDQHTISLQQEWATQWDGSPRKERMSAIDPNFPFDKYRANQWAQCSLLFQLQSNHLPLNAYLHRIKKSENKFCLNCWNLLNYKVKETVTHFLFECPSYEDERHTLDRKLGWLSRDLRAVLSEKEPIRELLRFIGRTKRVKTTLGDVSQF